MRNSGDPPPPVNALMILLALFSSNFLLLPYAWTTRMPAVARTAGSRHGVGSFSFPIFLSTTSDDDDSDRSASPPPSATREVDARQNLLDEASRLRQEAQDLESKLMLSRPQKQKEGCGVKIQEPITDVKDSIWTFSYRFSDTPESSSDDAKEQQIRRTFYSGKFSLRFRADGYTDIVSHEPRDGGRSDDIAIVKAWGWDVEESDQDDKKYLLFSVDVIPPDSQEQQRFYFQARQDRDARTGVLSFKEGTVTIKQDIVEAKATPGLWGLFSPKGILAQFRYVGDFVVRNSQQ